MAVRIGLAFNLKPSAPADTTAGAPTDPSASDDSRALRDDLPQPDLYAEWDEPATIDAVERALSTVGQVYRLEANASFPARLALIRPARRCGSSYIPISPARSDAYSAQPSV